MSLIDDINQIIDAELPDNNAQVITPLKQRTALKAITAKLSELLPKYLRIDLGGALTYTHNDLKVPSNRLMIIGAGTIISNGPLNDPVANPAPWDYNGGDTPESWSHDPALGKIWLPVEVGITEIFIRPTI